MLELHLPVAGIDVSWPLMVLFGVLLGLVSAALGIGAGVIAVPVLFGVYGMRFEVAVSSSLALFIGNSTLGVAGHWRRRNVDLALGLVLGVGVALGTVVGGWILDRVARGADVMLFGHRQPLAEVTGSIAFTVLLVWLASLTFKQVRRTVAVLRAGGVDQQESGGEPLPWVRDLAWPPRLVLRAAGGYPISLWPILGVGLAAGVLAGFLGVGGGFIMVPILLYWLGTRTVLAIGTSLVGILVGALVGTLQKALHDTIDWHLVGLLFAGALVGIPLGIKLTAIMPPHELRRAYAIFCIMGALISLAKLFY